MPFVDHLCFFFVVGVPLFVQPCAGSCHACFFLNHQQALWHMLFCIFCFVLLHGFKACCRLMCIFVSFLVLPEAAFLAHVCWPCTFFVVVGLVQSKSECRARLNVEI